MKQLRALQNTPHCTETKKLCEVVTRRSMCTNLSRTYRCKHYIYIYIYICICIARLLYEEVCALIYPVNIDVNIIYI